MGGWGGWGGVDEQSQKVQTSSFKIGIRDVENDKYNQHCWMLQIKVVESKLEGFSSQEKKIPIYLILCLYGMKGAH